MNTAINAYKKINKTEGHPIDDVIKAFYRTSNLILLAKSALESHNFEGCYNHTYKVKEILLVLEVCMQEDTPEQKAMAEQLRLSFNSLHRMITCINIRHDLQVCDALAAILENYAIVFTEVKSQVAASIDQEPASSNLALSA